MLDTKYYKDYRHNYLIIKDNGCLLENVYQRRMVTENKIRGILSSSEKHINGELLLYYEITSKQSLQSMFEGRTIGMEYLKKFFVQLKVVNDALQKYLLDGSCLVLLPEYIFQDMGTKEICFIYYPDPEEGRLAELIDFFIAKVDNEDMEAVETVYRVADLIGKEQFVLDEILEWFQDDVRDNEENRSENSDEADNMRAQEDLSWEEGSQEDAEPEDDRKLIKIIPPVAAAAIGAGMLAYFMYAFHLSYKEKIYLIAGWGVVIALLLGTAIWYFMPLIGRNGKAKNKEEQKPEKGEHTFAATYENSVSRESEMGNTVFLPWTENCENKLYGADRKNKYHIDLGRLPLTVGKLAGMVDMVINEQSISRMHARFSRSGNRIYITDLNSTNGTFRNGMRLEPNATELIEPGDEIRLGRLKFIYR